MEFFTVTANLDYSSYGDIIVENFLDEENAKKFMFEIERDFKNTICSNLELEIDEYTFSSNDQYGRVKSIHIESNTGEETAHIILDRKTFKDGVN
jgi:hypothetical protein